MSLLTSPSISLRKILFATDFSRCSEAALPYAIGLCRRYDGVLNIVSVVPAEICDNAQPPDRLTLTFCREQDGEACDVRAVPGNQASRAGQRWRGRSLQGFVRTDSET